MKAKFTFIVLLLLATVSAMAQQTRYVKPVASGSADGSSWANASADLQAMITASAANDQVWVAEGTYYPTATTDRTISFRMKAGVSIYGDFPATGNPVFADRNLALYETILSGDIDKNDGPNFANNSGNSYHVVSNNNNGVNSTAVLDGFTISGGNANSGTYPNNSGGGMLNIFTSPTLVNVIFYGNNAGVNGGAMLNVSSVPSLKNVIFAGNNANGQGGAIANSNASPNITNATFWENNAGSGGGGMFSYTLSSPTIKNSIFWGNTTGGTTVSSIGGDFPGVTYSDIEGGYAGTGNINQDPIFLNSSDPDGADNKLGTADDGLTLRPCSPAVNTGNNTGITTIDLLGRLRIFNTTADMGAYEYQSNTVTGTRLYVNAAAAPNGDGSSWATAYNNLQAALASARLCTNIDEIWVAKGTYKPTSGTDRTISFELVPNVDIYGSFAGNETDTSQRTAAVMAANPTVLSGDIDGVPDVVTGSGSTLVISGNAGNSLHVIFNNGNGVSTGNSRLDGFTITGGNANQSAVSFASGAGAGIYFGGTGTRMRNLIFTGNSATNGGGIFGDGHNLDIANASFINNYAGGGAGVDFRNAGITLNTVSFTGGKGGFGAGLNCQDGDVSATNVTFTNNNGGEGGGLRTYHSGVSLNNVSFSGNSASLNGGGMYSYGCGLTFNQTYFTNNTATFDGGGIYILGGPTKINRSFFLNNTARNGGGLYMTSGLFDNRNNVIAGNHATQKGGGFYFEDTGFSSGTFMYFATIAGNTAVQDGAGIFGAGSGGAEYYYCIVWGNKKGTLENNVGGYANLYFSNIGSYIPPFLSQHDIDQNPLFVDAANPAGADAILGTADDGLALLPCSPSINYIPYPYVDSLSGYVNTFPSSTSQDILFNPRRINFFADMGAYESSSTGLSLPAVYTAKTQDIADTVFMEPGCHIMAKIVPDPTATGVNLLAGDVEVKEWVETAPFNMVRRHYQVTPANNASTAKARVTLYFTQEDFDAYNAGGSPVQLPTTPYILDPNIANIEVVKYSGSSPDGLPGGYPAQTPEIIPNSALTIRWIGRVWAISFDVTGFSGFFIKAGSGTIPVTLISFSGKHTDTGNLLNWKTTNETNFSHFEIERSEDGQRFEKMGVKVSNTSKNYAFLDAAATAPQYYYRLKMVDVDGKYSYSAIIRINSNPGKEMVGEVYPNPSTGAVNFQINAVENSTWTISVLDVLGRVLQTFTKDLTKGSHAIRLDNLQQGLNVIKVEWGTVHEFRKVIRQ